MEVARERGDITEVELEVPAVADPARRDEHVADDHGPGGRRRCADPTCSCSPAAPSLRDADPAASLEISRQVSTAVIEVVRGAVAAEPAWVVAKGGITSHDVAVRGLGIRRATVLGPAPARAGVGVPARSTAPRPRVVGTPLRRASPARCRRTSEHPGLA